MKIFWGLIKRRFKCGSLCDGVSTRREAQNEHLQAGRTFKWQGVERTLSDCPAPLRGKARDQLWESSLCPWELGGASFMIIDIALLVCCHV